MDWYAELKRRFAEQRDPENAAKMAAYMRNLFAFYGLATPKRRAQYRDMLREAKKRGIVDWELLDKCYEDEYRELQYFVIDYLEAMGDFLCFEDMPKLKRYAKSKQWWDSIDGLDTVIGRIGLADRRMNELMLEWSADEDFWLRRIAIDHQLGRKEQTDRELLAQIIVNNLGDREFFINKAIGWSLREYAKTDPEWVRDFLAKYGERLDKLSVREASKHL